MALYSALLAVAIALHVLFHLRPVLKAGQDREALRQRFGHVPERLRAFASGRRVVWLHAVSVGETLAASRLVQELEAALGEGWALVISTTTPTGQQLARQRFGAERVFYMPLDFARAVRPYLDTLQPACLVLMESEVWPRMMHECRKRGVPVVVVNARVSDRSYRRSKWVRWIWSRVLRKATLWLAQTAEDARRLVELGAPAEDVRVGGNLKYDVRPPTRSPVAELIREAAAGRPVIVAGSTVHGEPLDEDCFVIQAWEGRLRRDFQALLVIAPRHPERFDSVHSVALEFPTLKVTEMLAGLRRADAAQPLTPPSKAVEVIVLDTIGDLAAVYGVASIAFIGGSLVPRGGHNPLEPAQFGVPVAMGPSFENFRDIVAKMQAARGIRIVQDAASLESTLIELLLNADEAKTIGARGREVFATETGATRRAVDAILGLVHDSSGGSR